MTKDRKPDDKEQSKLFLDKAREIDADSAGSNADFLMGRLAKTKPDPKPAKTTKERRSTR